MKIKLILKTLKKMGQTADALLDILAGGHTYPRLSRITREKVTTFTPQEKHSFYSLLSHLRKEGLIEKKSESKKGTWTITKKGLEKLKQKMKSTIPYPTHSYKKEKDDSLNIVAFDIPEKERKKRNWLRGSLVELEFKRLQKSLWIGKHKLPEAFLKDLKDLKLLDYIQIFKVHKSGTINRDI